MKLYITKFIKKRSNYILILLFIFAGMNIWLIYEKAILNRNYNLLKSELLHKEGDIPTIKEAIRFEALQENPKSPLMLITIFTDSGCAVCVREEIKYLNEWKKTYNHTLKIYYLGETMEYLERFGLEVAYQKIDSSVNLFNVALTTQNPISAIVDENQFVQAIHTNDTSRPGSDRRRDQFYKRANSLFLSLTKINAFKDSMGINVE